MNQETQEQQEEHDLITEAILYFVRESDPKGRIERFVAWLNDFLIVAAATSKRFFWSVLSHALLTFAVVAITFAFWLIHWGVFWFSLSVRALGKPRVADYIQWLNAAAKDQIDFSIQTWARVINK